MNTDESELLTIFNCNLSDIFFKKLGKMRSHKLNLNYL